MVEHQARSGPAGGGGSPARTEVEARAGGCGPPPPCRETPRPAPERATVRLVDDRALAAALVSGGPGGLAGVYDAYADRLFAYAVTLLRDRDAAADAVHDALLVASERAGQLRDPDRLRPWLYAITRNECLRQLRDRRRAAPLEEAGDVIDETADVGAGARGAELRELVWSAAASLNPGEREVLELSVRHGLAGTDLAAALGTTLNAAHALTSRARAQLERALGALLVARTGRSECAELDALLAGWDGRLTPLLRKRLARHVEKCETCGETRRHRLNPVALLAGVPFVLAPPELRERIVRDAGDLRLVAHSDEVTGPSAAPAGSGAGGRAGGPCRSVAAGRLPAAARRPPPGGGLVAARGRGRGPRAARRDRPERGAAGPATGGGRRGGSAGHRAGPRRAVRAGRRRPDHHRRGHGDDRGHDHTGTDHDPWRAAARRRHHDDGPHDDDAVHQDRPAHQDHGGTADEAAHQDPDPPAHHDARAGAHRRDRLRAGRRRRVRESGLEARLTATVTGAAGRVGDRNLDGGRDADDRVDDGHAPAGSWVATAAGLAPGVDIPWSATATIGRHPGHLGHGDSPAQLSRRLTAALALTAAGSAERVCA